MQVHDPIRERLARYPAAQPELAPGGEPAADADGLPSKRRAVSASCRYAEWTETGASASGTIPERDEIELYLREPIDEDKDLLSWWKDRVRMHEGDPRPDPRSPFSDLHN